MRDFWRLNASLYELMLRIPSYASDKTFKWNRLQITNQHTEDKYMCLERKFVQRLIYKFAL